MSEQPEYEVLIVGAGFGGICTGVALRKAGIHNILIVDRWPKVGGTWLANSYPGVAVDIPSFVYSFSFAQRNDWSRVFAPGAELQRYAEDVVDDFGLRSKLRLNTTVAAARFDESEDLWRVSIEGGDEITARFLIGAFGVLERPKLPDIEGVESFGGKLMHTALWDHDYDLAGKRVAIIGTGASALQVIPEIAETVEHLTVYQRTPIWVAPKLDWDTGPLTRMALGNPLVRRPLRAAGTLGASIGFGGLLMLGERSPLAAAPLETALKLWMRTQVPDPVLRDKLTPKYMFGCKRPSMSNAYLKAFTRADVELVTEPIDRITATGVVTADGTEREVDMLIVATGFKIMDRGTTPPYPTYGRDGVELGEFWHEHRFPCYQGVSVHGFPNAFMLAGPFGFAPGAYNELIESTAAHATRAIAETRRRGTTRCEIRQQALDRYVEDSRRRNEQLPFAMSQCDGSNTYYLNYQGEPVGVRPALLPEMWWRNRRFPLDHYEYTSVARPRAVRRRPARAKEAVSR